MRMSKLFKIWGMSFLFFGGCSPDYSINDQQETRVVVDSFVQAEEIEDLDVLVVVDTSGSMLDDADEVGSGLEIFRSDIEGLTSTYRIAFITTDADRLGYTGYYDTSSSSIDLMLAPGLLPSVSGEAGFESTYVFISSDEGIEFKRDEADFLLFLISDEDEQSSISSAIFKDWLQNEFSEVNHDVVSITSLEDSECSWEIGFKYIELSALYNKDAIDICAEGWEVWLAESSFLTQMIREIQLTEIPILESVVVYVDQQITYAWTYSEPSNSIYLDVIPDYGSVVEAGYKVYMD